MDQLDALCLLERLDNLFALVLAHEPGVHVHAGELRSDGPMYQRCSDGRVDATGQATDSSAGANLSPNGFDLFVDDVGHSP